MDFKVGDKVKFLNNVGGGEVNKVVDKKIVEVTTEDGFSLPVLPNEPEINLYTPPDHVLTYTSFP